MFPALKASCALVSIKRLTSCFESPSVVSILASRLLVVRSPCSRAKRAVLARIFDAIGSDAALASLNPSATLLITISAGCWLDDDLPMTSEVGGVLAHPTTRLVTIRTLNNLVVVFIRLFFWYGVLGAQSKNGEEKYIYDYRYDEKIFSRVRQITEGEEEEVFINLAFSAGLDCVQ